MPGMLFGFPFDEELFLMQWKAAQDPTLTALYDCGAVQPNSMIQNLISTGSDIYTVPMYDVLGGTPDNYDGVTDILTTSPGGSYQTGVVYGRAHSWKDKDFIRDFNSGADPMKQIVSQVSKFWQKQRQKILLAELNGIFAIADDTSDNWDAWQSHTFDIATEGETVADTNVVSDATAIDAIQAAVGDFGDQFTLVVMHSKVATSLAKLQLLSYRKYTDIKGIERTLRIADWNGLTVIIDDGVPVTASAAATGAKEYTTYLFGAGAIQYATAPVDTPVETDRVKLTEGGYNLLITRLRETLHPNGFSFVKPSSGYTHSPTNAQLGEGATDTSNWSIAQNPKIIGITRIISNG